MRTYETLNSYVIVQGYQDTLTVFNLKDNSEYYLNLKTGRFFQVALLSKTYNIKINTKFFILGENYELYWDEICYYS